MGYDNHLEILKSEFEFEEFRISNLYYPEITGFNKLRKQRFFEVDIQFEIDKKNNPKNVEKSEFTNKIPRMVFQENKFKKIAKPEFLNESLRLIKSFKNWRSYKKEEKYVDLKFFKTIHFAYHSEYYSNEKKFEINPEERPSFTNNNDKYERIIKCKYGCDGVANLLCMVEKNGDLTNIELIGISGKVSSNFAIKELKSLGKLNPGSKNGKKVRTQIDLLVYI